MYQILLRTPPCMLISGHSRILHTYAFLKACRRVLWPPGCLDVSRLYG